MKIFTVAAALLALIAVPAYAQVNGKRHQGDAKKTEEKKPEVDEKAYKAALERIPDSKEKYDPWGTAVAVSGAKENPAAGIELGERDPDALVAAPDPTAAADELIGLDFKRE